MTGGATYHRHRSDQEIGTPGDFLGAVEERFGLIDWDLAAKYENNKCQVGPDRYFGPDHGIDDLRDSLKQDWREVRAMKGGVLWLNPPFANIEPWAEKCASYRCDPFWTLLLVPASIATNWWRDHVRGKSMVFALQPRLVFVGQKHRYPKDLALCAYGFGVCGEDNWEWKKHCQG
jgi:hypothetical protein